MNERMVNKIAEVNSPCFGRRPVCYSHAGGGAKANMQARARDINITDENGKVIFSKLGVNTGGETKTADLTTMLAAGNHTLTVNVQPSAKSVLPSSESKYVNDISFNLTVNCSVESGEDCE